MKRKVPHRFRTGTPTTDQAIPVVHLGDKVCQRSTGLGFEAEFQTNFITGAREIEFQVQFFTLPNKRRDALHDNSGQSQPEQPGKRAFTVELLGLLLREKPFERAHDDLLEEVWQPIEANLQPGRWLRRGSEKRAGSQECAILDRELDWRNASIAILHAQMEGHGNSRKLKRVSIAIFGRLGLGESFDQLDKSRIVGDRDEQNAKGLPLNDIDAQIGKDRLLGIDAFKTFWETIA